MKGQNTDESTKRKKPREGSDVCVAVWVGGDGYHPPFKFRLSTGLRMGRALQSQNEGLRIRYKIELASRSSVGIISRSETSTEVQSERG